MDNKIYGIKEVYDCIIKTTYNIEINNHRYLKGEPIICFDKLQIIDFNEVKKRVSANGGYNNKNLISWENTEEVQVTFSQGILSKMHLAFLGNSYTEQSENIEVPYVETKEILDNFIELKYPPIKDTIFIYDLNNNSKINNYRVENNIIFFNDVIKPYTLIQIFYDFLYDNGNKIIIGKELFKGYLEFSAKTKLKDDTTGKIVTGIFKIPKIKIMSNFSITLGNDASPAVGNFKISGFPIGSKGSEKTLELFLLKDDINSDI